MKERPILFSAPMVMALLEGRKTMTRRIIKPQPDCVAPYGSPIWFEVTTGKKKIECPYGQVGDRLWVRETICIAPKFWADPDDTCIPDCDGDLRHCSYKADSNSVDGMRDYKLKWTPPRYMPRWASRITLEITGVRVERLNDIRDEDTKNEGLSEISKDGLRTIKYGIPDSDGYPGNDNHGWSWTEWEISPRLAFKKLWESINGAESWSANPWVWVIEFKRITQ